MTEVNKAPKVAIVGTGKLLDVLNKLPKSVQETEGTVLAVAEGGLETGDPKVSDSVLDKKHAAEAKK